MLTVALQTLLDPAYVVPDEIKTRINMTAEQLEAWALALESGKYRQGRSFLRQRGRSGVEHCCLGVLCEISGLPFAPSNFNSRLSAFAGETSSLPLSLSQRFGIGMFGRLPFNVSLTGAHNNDGSVCILSELNDHDVPFADIAKIIRKCYAPKAA